MLVQTDLFLREGVAELGEAVDHRSHLPVGLEGSAVALSEVWAWLHRSLFKVAKLARLRDQFHRSPARDGSRQRLQCVTVAEPAAEDRRSSLRRTLVAGDASQRQALSARVASHRFRRATWRTLTRNLYKALRIRFDSLHFRLVTNRTSTRTKSPPLLPSGLTESRTRLLAS